jgi:hypothetical protein
MAHIYRHTHSRRVAFYCNVDGQSVAKQRFIKQTSTTEAVFSVGSVKRSYLKKTALQFSSEFSVEDSHGKFVDLVRFKVWLEGFINVYYLECVIQWDCYSSCVLVVVPGEDQCVCKSAIALYLNVIKRDCNQGANKSNHPN